MNEDINLHSQPQVYNETAKSSLLISTIDTQYLFPHRWCTVTMTILFLRKYTNNYDLCANYEILMICGAIIYDFYHDY